MQICQQVQTFSPGRAFFMSAGHAPLRGEMLRCEPARLSVRKSRRKADPDSSSDPQC